MGSRRINLIGACIVILVLFLTSCTSYEKDPQNLQQASSSQHRPSLAELFPSDTGAEKSLTPLLKWILIGIALLGCYLFFVGKIGEQLYRFQDWLRSFRRF